MTTSRRFASLLATVMALVTFTAARPAAHPTSTTSVAVALPGDGRFHVTLIADAEALLAKIELPPGGAPSSTTAPPAPLDVRLRAQSAVLLARIEMALDGVRVSPAVHDIVVDAKGVATIRLGGAASGVTDLTWSTTLVFGAYPMVLRVAGEPERVRWLQGQEASGPMALRGATTSQALTRGIWLGFTHIVPYGLDHILFVVGLFLLSAGGRQLFWQVTAFTLAHSVTLGLGLYGWVSIPATVVEPLIALSVAYVGIENVLTERLRSWRVVVVFVFGLLHGLGFAEGVARLALSPSDLLVTLVSFNVGVELGQLTVIAAAACAVRIMVGLNASWRQPVTRAASAGIGAAGLFWVVTRLASP